MKYALLGEERGETGKEPFLLQLVHQPTFVVVRTNNNM